MLLRYLNIDSYFFQKSNTSVLIRLFTFKDIWIFNCPEGTQVNLISQGFKINNLSKIILMDLHINNISGLLGLLSSLNLIGRTKSLHIYGPSNLKYYLDLCKKYSRTNFSYIIYFHILTSGLIINHYGCRIYTLYSKFCYNFIIVSPEQSGTFYLNRARNNNLLPGPLYGKLKKGYTFLLPDGFTIDGTKLTSSNYLGYHFSLFTSNFYQRVIFENTSNSRVLLSR
uniref:Ribonuclease Z n=1 Tax=Chondria tumulosa TaxID=2740715 RepID=A0A896SVV5_9FLOR|nr:ribonuclease Z [Chondria tumulosa]QSD57030.1 ribonuclease Z [Chondria tumulosa]